MRRKPRHIRNRDRNLERAFTWGGAARLNNTPLTECPNLISVFGTEYGRSLADAWMRGWAAKDVEQHAMKGAD